MWRMEDAWGTWRMHVAHGGCTECTQDAWGTWRIHVAAHGGRMGHTEDAWGAWRMHGAHGGCIKAWAHAPSTNLDM